MFLCLLRLFYNFSIFSFILFLIFYCCMNNFSFFYDLTIKMHARTCSQLKWLITAVFHRHQQRVSTDITLFFLLPATCCICVGVAIKALPLNAVSTPRNAFLWHPERSALQQTQIFGGTIFCCCWYVAASVCICIWLLVALVATAIIIIPRIFHWFYASLLLYSMIFCLTDIFCFCLMMPVLLLLCPNGVVMMSVVRALV